MGEEGDGTAGDEVAGSMDVDGDGCPGVSGVVGLEPRLLVVPPLVLPPERAPTLEMTRHPTNPTFPHPHRTKAKKKHIYALDRAKTES